MLKPINIINTQFPGSLSPGRIAVGVARTRYHGCPPHPRFRPSLSLSLSLSLSVTALLARRPPASRFPASRRHPVVCVWPYFCIPSLSARMQRLCRRSTWNEAVSDSHHVLGLFGSNCHWALPAGRPQTRFAGRARVFCASKDTSPLPSHFRFRVIAEAFLPVARGPVRHGARRLCCGFRI